MLPDQVSCMTHTRAISRYRALLALLPIAIIDLLWSQAAIANRRVSSAKVEQYLITSKPRITLTDSALTA
jgi:hypothetical protein